MISVAKEIECRDTRRRPVSERGPVSRRRPPEDSAPLSLHACLLTMLEKLTEHAQDRKVSQPVPGQRAILCFLSTHP